MVVSTLLVACGPTPIELPQGPDLTDALGPGEVRAGVVEDEDALFGGISAEGRVGDIKIYNQHVQFVIQGVRQGSYYAPQGGNVIDADIVRWPDVPGRDMVDEWFPNFGVGRMLDADVVEVVEDGSTGVALVRASGDESPMHLIEGAVGAHGLIPDLGLTLVNEYRLEPDSWFLEVTSTATATRDSDLTPGDVLLAGMEMADLFEPGAGLNQTPLEERSFVAYLGKKNEVALGIFAPDGETAIDSAGLEVFSFVIRLAGAFTEPVHLAAGESFSWTRLYGVGPDLATLTDAWLEGTRTWTQMNSVDGVVEAADGGVAGARVHVLVDDLPFTVATTDVNGSFSAKVPLGTATTFVDGQGRSLFFDLPDGYAPMGPYAAEPAKNRVIASLESGARPIAYAQGRGVTEDLGLEEPGVIRITVDDGGPFSAWVDRDADREASPYEALLPPRPGGHDAAGWGRGTVDLVVPAGPYDLVVHRGSRFEVHTEEGLEAAPGVVLEIPVHLEGAYDHDGWLYGDHHVHAGPSADGKITMEERLLVHAGAGVQLYYGTDHDHIADYAPLVDAMRLEDHLRSVVASEMSPVLRGHLNLYPLTVQPEEPNGGAWPWWIDRVETTGEEFNILRQRHPEALIQVNHPIMVGLADIAGWTPGNIGRKDYWSNDFDAIELLNGGSYSAYQALFVDLVGRGHRVTPVGVTDSHDHFGGHPGMNGTFLGCGVTRPDACTDSLLKQAMAAGRTVVSRGPFLKLSIAPGSTIDGPRELEATGLAPSWITVDELRLWRNGEVVETVTGTHATFSLDAEEDAWFAVEASGSQPMVPVYDATPWAMTNAIYLDLAGDGWEPPLPDLSYD